MEEFKKTIDIEKIIKDKNPTLHKWLPRFLLNYLKRKLHEYRINECVWINRDKFGYDFNDACLKYIGANVTWQGLENLPETGGVILVANHPLGGIDGLAIIQAVTQKRRDIRSTVNDILTNLTNFEDLFVGVNKVGTTSIDALKAIDNFYASTGVSMVFPAGMVSRKQNGKIEDLEWKKSFVTKSILYNKPVLPVYVDGKNSPFFYNFALWRKRLGIKANIEMFFLPDEMFSLKNKNIKLKFGKLIMPDTFDRSKTHQQWAQVIKEEVYKLESN
ncbi:MAG TPA: 1-acyl-sn-glycerol-3-phosphate acyltransferase [Bacteroidia bacterium]|jgi:putative hemolysin|nr:1-acyl-sn-glycerol-3-phosphate acyltransferase [Bacteroidia bacterium]